MNGSRKARWTERHRVAMWIGVLVAITSGAGASEAGPAGPALDEAGRMSSPAYDSDETQLLVERMIEAHGGMEAWRRARAISYQHVMFWPDPPGNESNWVVIDEVVDQSTRRLYQHYPLTDTHLVDDGEDLWTVDWTMITPPIMMAHTTYYFTFLPWLTQDDGVRLEDAGTGRLPEWETELRRVRMSFEGGGDAFVLFIDPETYELRGTQVILGDPEILAAFNVPENVKEVPGATHSYRAFQTVDDLRVPLSFRTRGPNGSTIGYHINQYVDLDAEFDETRLVRPAEAVSAR